MADFLEAAHTSTPLLNRLIVTYVENGVCITEVWECFDLEAITYALGGDPSEVICTNVAARKQEVVATIRANATEKVTFNIRRLLPSADLSNFFRLMKKNCPIKMYLARATECEDLNDPNEFSVLECFGPAIFGNYTRTQHLNMNESDATAIYEGTSVTAYGWEQYGHNNLTLRGDVSTANLIDVTVCDLKRCGDPCDDDSDGCQKWFAIQDDGAVLWTDDQFTTEALTAVIPGWTGTAAAICCVAPTSPNSAQIAVLEINLAGEGVLHTASRNEIIEGGAVVWTSYTVDINANTFEAMNACHSTGLSLWMVGENASIYQYDLVNGLVSPIESIANMTATFNAIERLGSTYVIGGDAATVIRSHDGGDSFLQITVTDPATGLDLDVAINIVDVSLISETNWSIATSDDRILYTLDDGNTWASQLIPGQGGGNITSFEFDGDVGYMTRDNIVWKTYYGNCQPWKPLPESSDLFPVVDSLARVVICPEDPNMFVAVGSLDGAVGTIVRGTGNYI